MPVRYLAFIANDGPDHGEKLPCLTQRAVQRCHMHPICSTAEFSLLVGEDTPLLQMDGNAGVVIGTLFDNAGALVQEPNLDTLSAAIHQSHGRKLIDACWGGYVAFLQGEAGQLIEIIRDPSGMVPCYYIERDGVIVVSADVGSLRDLGLCGGLDWNSIGYQLLVPELRTARTGLLGITELIRGHRITVRTGVEGIALTQLWSPWDFAGRGNAIGDEGAAIEQVRSVTRNCIGAWASRFRHILLGVSGGLDSSIVAACLGHAGGSFSCQTIATHDPAGDERFQARAVAEAVGSPLFEAFYDVRNIDLTRSNAAHLPRPVSRSFAQELDRISIETAGNIGADAFFSGGGGDNAFCLQYSAAPIADRLLVEGLGPGAWKTTYDICDLTGSSIGAVMGMAVRHAWGDRRSYRWKADRSFLNLEAIQDVDEAVVHPWLVAPKDMLPGKARHIAMVLRFQNHMEGYQQEQVASKIAPLMSQPLIELCLRIPSWMWCSGGRNRAVARKAFAADLPPLIVERRAKGTPDGFLAEIFETYRATILELLADGLLARHGLIDAPAVVRELHDPRPVRGYDYARILRLVDVEVWARAWNG